MPEYSGAATPDKHDVAIVLSWSPSTALVRVPYAYRHIPQALGWRKWDPAPKAWRILGADLGPLVARLEGAGCTVRWRGGKP